MLKSHEIDTEQPSAVGGNRVTPEELSQALAAIEARKQAEASRLAGTIPIDQAVSELHLDSTSEEIWVEVQAQRVKAAAAQHEQRLPRQARPHETQAAPQQSTTPQQSTATHSKYRKKWAAFLAPLILVGILFHNGSLPHFRSHPTHVSAPRLTSLAQVPDGKEIYADDLALVQISKGKPQAQVTVSENPSGNRWTLVKVSGHVYLRGYIAETASLQPLQGNALHIYNDANSGELQGIKTSNITLRVDSIQLDKSGGDDDFSEITVPNFQTDPLTTLSPWH